MTGSGRRRCSSSLELMLMSLCWPFVLFTNSTRTCSLVFSTRKASILLKFLANDARKLCFNGSEGCGRRARQNVNVQVECENFWVKLLCLCFEFWLSFVQNERRESTTNPFNIFFFFYSLINENENEFSSSRSFAIHRRQQAKQN